MGGANLVGMPSDTHGNDAQGEPGHDIDADTDVDADTNVDTTQGMPEVDPTADHGPGEAGDPGATSRPRRSAQGL